MDIKELNKTQLILLSLLITFVVSIATGIVTVSLMNQAPKSVPKTINNVIQRTIEKVVQVPTPVKNVNTTTSNNSSQSSAFLGDGDALISIYDKDEYMAPVDDTSPDSSSSDGTSKTTDTDNNTSSSDKVSSKSPDNTVADSTGIGVTETKVDQSNNLGLTQDNPPIPGSSLQASAAADSFQTGVNNSSKTSENTSSDTSSKEKILEHKGFIGKGVILSDIGLILAESDKLKGHNKLMVILKDTDFDVSVLMKFDNGFTVLKIPPKNKSSKK